MVIRYSFFRLFLLISLSLVILTSGLLYVVSSNFQNRFLEAVDNELIERASNISHNPGQPKLRTNEKMIEKVKNDYFQIINEGGQIIVSSITTDHLWPVNRDLLHRAFNGITGFETINFRGERYRIVYFPLSGNRIINLAKSLEETEEIIGKTRNHLMIISIFSTIIIITLSWLFSRMAFSPIKAITSYAEQVRAGNLGKEIEINAKGREIERISNLFKEILANLRTLSETQKRFTQDVSHEIRSPLTSLRGSIEVALRKKRSPEEYEDVLRGNLFDVIRLIRITDDLLFLARADNKIIELRKNWFDLNHLLRAIIARFEHDGIEIIKDFKEGMEYYGDINLLEQAFSNIIENSIKYTPEGGSITISTGEEKDSIWIKIRDTGIGIPEEDIPHIFERFYRVNKERSRKTGGTGLGLSIAKWIIDSHDGTISVDSTVGSGTTFTISLPKENRNSIKNFSLSLVAS